MSRHLDDALEAAIEIANLSPSAHNTKPWDVRRISDSEVSLHRDPTRTLDAGDPTTRQATIACGMFAEGLLLAGTAVGLDVAIENRATLPRDTHLATLRLGLRDRGDPSTIEMLRLRRTVRRRYQPEPLGLDLPQVRGDSVRIVPIINDAEREQVGMLVGAALRLSMSLPNLRRELADLVHWGRGSEPTGMAIEDLVPDTQPDGDARTWWLEKMDLDSEVVRHRDNWATSPTILVIATGRDDPHDWFEAGRAGMEILVNAAATGMSHDIAAGLVEIPPIVGALRSQFNFSDRPQIVMRLGRPILVENTA